MAFIRGEDIFPAISPLSDLMRNSRNDYPCNSRHGAIVTAAPSTCNQKRVASPFPQPRSIGRPKRGNMEASLSSCVPNFPIVHYYRRASPVSTWISSPFSLLFNTLGDWVAASDPAFGIYQFFWLNELTS
jgi:hypothetical protein